MSLIPQEIYEECFKAFNTQLTKHQRQMLKVYDEYDKVDTNKVVIATPRKCGKSSLILALKGIYGGFPKKKEKKCFVFR